MKEVSVAWDKWLEIILKEHRPTQTEYGEQRDPTYVVVCSCGNPGYKQARESTPDTYQKHFMKVLKENMLIDILGPI